MTTHKLLFGKPWLALIREVLKSGYDLALLGTARPDSFAKALFGGTSIKMIRKCPCPVWVTKSEAEEHSGGVVVAHCLTEVGHQALAWGAAQAAASKSSLRVIHAVKLTSGVFGPSLSEAQIETECEQRRKRIEAEVEALAEVPPSVEIIVKLGTPAAVIYQALREQPAELLVMGTVGRSGIAGFITGNTAEALLPWLHCSLLALKPEGFETPVKLEE